MRGSTLRFWRAIFVLAFAVMCSAGCADELRVAYAPSYRLAVTFGAPIALRPGFSPDAGKLTNALLEAYVRHRQAETVLRGPAPALTESMLLSYVGRRNGSNGALASIDALVSRSAIDPEALADYAQKRFQPTTKKIALSVGERVCLTQAIYHEARGESEAGQWAVANVVINRALSKKFPRTICGVVFQNADQGRYRCQFTFACDGRSDGGTEKSAWQRATKIADAAYREFQRGKRPGVVPNSTLYYHTTAVSPDWSNRLRRVAAIGSHMFYAGR